MLLRSIPITILVVAAVGCALACSSPNAVSSSLAGAPPEVATDGGADAEVAEPCAALDRATVTTLARLSVGRYSPAAAQLLDGRVLVAGGFDFARKTTSTSSDLVDLETGAVSAGPSLATARNFGAQAITPQGALLVFGGFHPQFGSLDDVESLMPGAASFVAGARAMSEAREAATATFLEDGRVLLAGGLEAQGFHFRASAEIYDPVTHAFAPPVTMSAARAFHASVRLPSGEVLVIGGDSGKGELASAERFDTTNGAPGRFVKTKGDRAVSSKALAAVRLADGRVLVTGGANAKDGPLTNADLYDPASDTFAPSAAMATRRMAHSLSMLADGRVLAVGGWSDGIATDALEVFDPSAGRWETLPVHLARGRLDHVAIPVGRCRVLVVGGQHTKTGAPPEAPLEIELITLPRRGP